MMRSLYVAMTVFLLSFPTLANAQANKVTLTTYYPAPFGAYDRLRLVPQTALGAGTCTAATEGTLYIESVSKAINQCVSNAWVPLAGGYWSTEPAAFTDGGVSIDRYYLYKTYADLTVNRPQVGVGTRLPLAPLHVTRNTNGWDGPPTLILENTSVTDPSVGILLKSFAANTAGATLAEVAKINADYENAMVNPNSHLSIWLRDGITANNNTLTEQFVFSGQGRLAMGLCTTGSLLCMSAKGITGAAAGAVPYLALNTNSSTGGDVLIVDSFGRVGINRTTALTERLEVEGNIKATNLILTSDAGLKKDITPVNNALDKISRLHGVSFEWKDESLGKGKNMGVVAQDVEKIFPEAVYGKNGEKGVNYPSLIAPLIEAVKELKTKNEILSRELQNQSIQIHEQQQKIKSLQSSLETREPLLTP
ncbi:MAG: tail fiber domain-containing protein [Candidatus Omnitrophica bacterium]|nr:tail fiber domain-containing protein [Candidatus Omnitrophota bacterium]